MSAVKDFINKELEKEDSITEREKQHLREFFNDLLNNKNIGYSLNEKQKAVRDSLLKKIVNL